MKSQGRAFKQWESADERARFVTMVQTMLDRWRYAENGRTWSLLAEQTGISVDQLNKWLRGTQSPSGPSMEKLFAAGVFEETPESMLGTKPWMSSEPDAGVIERARNQGKKKKQPAKKQQKAAPAPELEVSSPEFEVAEIDIHDAISRLEIPVKTKLQLSALVALAESGAVFDLDVKVRAR